MTQEHPITPPPELLQQWVAEIWHEGTPVRVAASDIHIATLCSAVLRQAAWSFSLSLSAIEVKDHLMAMADEIDAANGGMPEWSSLAEEALAEIQEMEGAMYSADLGCDFSATRRALEYLQELESNG